MKKRNNQYRRNDFPRGRRRFPVAVGLLMAVVAAAAVIALAVLKPSSDSTEPTASGNVGESSLTAESGDRALSSDKSLDNGDGENPSSGEAGDERESYPGFESPGEEEGPETLKGQENTGESASVAQEPIHIDDILPLPEDIDRGLFVDCGKNADGSPSPSWYPGKTIRDLATGEVTYKWDRYASTLDLLDKYGAIYRKNDDQKIAYLTFDCGYEIGVTAKLLDTLKEKNVNAVFFCSGEFVAEEKELVKRMEAEGHIIGNHTDTHPVMVYKSDEEFIGQLTAVQDKVEQALGHPYQMSFYRPPEGATNERDLCLAQRLGYTTVLWSFAYYDYNPEKQMPAAEALEAAEIGLHDGCVYLLHAESETNAAILGDLIDYIRGEGYEIRRIDE